MENFLWQGEIRPVISSSTLNKNFITRGMTSIFYTLSFHRNFMGLIFHCPILITFIAFIKREGHSPARSWWIFEKFQSRKFRVKASYLKLNLYAPPSPHGDLREYWSHFRPTVNNGQSRHESFSKLDSSKLFFCRACFPSTLW